MFLLHFIHTRTPRGEQGGQDNLASCLDCHIREVDLSDLSKVTAAPSLAPSPALRIILGVWLVAGGRF